MADLDAELLALAGDSSDEGKSPKVPAQKAPSTGPVARPPASPAAPSQTAATPKKTPKKPAKKRDDSEEEGEASSGSDAESVPMSESAGEPGSPDSNSSGPLFPVENKYYSEKDKTEVLALPEVEREAILADRAAILERKQQDNILKRLYQGYKAQSGEKSQIERKRKAGSASLEEGERKSSRQRTTLAGKKVGEASASLELYKAQRERKGQLDEQRRADLAAGKSSRRRGSGSSASEADAEGESEIDWDDKPKADSGPQSDEPADLIDYNRVLIGRRNFALVCFYPGFEETVKDCYVRVAVGPDPATGETTYRMAKILGVTEGKPYGIEGNNGRTFVTHQYVTTSVGNAKREWPFIFCSMSRITERELSRYKGMITNEGHLLPTKKFLNSKIDQINRLVNHKFTEAELQKKLERQGVLKLREDALERKQLLARRVEAERSGDLDEVKKIDDKVKELEGPKLAFGTKVFKGPVEESKEKTQQQRLAELNRANQKANTEHVRRAQIIEIKRKRERMVAIERGEALPDPCARVKVQPKTHFDHAAGPAKKPSEIPKVNSSVEKALRERTGKESPNESGQAILDGDLDDKSREQVKFYDRFKQVYSPYGIPGDFKILRGQKPMAEQIICALDIPMDVKIEPYTPRVLKIPEHLTWLTSQREAMGYRPKRPLF